MSELDKRILEKVKSHPLYSKEQAMRHVRCGWHFLHESRTIPLPDYCDYWSVCKRCGRITVYEWDYPGARSGEWTVVHLGFIPDYREFVNLAKEAQKEIERPSLKARLKEEVV